MKAKDIALLCTAAAGAGAAAGAAVSSKGRASKAAPKKKKTAAPMKKAEKNTSVIIDRKYTAVSANAPASPIYIGCESTGGIITAVYRNGRDLTAYRIKSASETMEIRCPSGITAAESSESCTLFITAKGGVFVYEDPEREPVFCGLTDPEYICASGGKFFVFSDSLLYICTDTGEIEKTVSLGSMIDIGVSDICDAESSDGSFSAARVNVKKVCFFENGIAAVITADNRSFLMNCDDDFCSFEKTYDNIIDVCAFEGFAYYLCRLTDGYGIIKTGLYSEGCETLAKYALCGNEKEPLKLLSTECGIGVLYKDGTVKFLLPELADESRKNEYKTCLKGLNAAFAEISVRDIFIMGNECGAVSEGQIICFS